MAPLIASKAARTGTRRCEVAILSAAVAVRWRSFRFVRAVTHDMAGLLTDKAYFTRKCALAVRVSVYSKQGRSVRIRYR